jgi:hypothetical protein
MASSVENMENAEDGMWTCRAVHMERNAASHVSIVVGAYGVFDFIWQGEWEQGSCGEYTLINLQFS